MKIYMCGGLSLNQKNQISRPVWFFICSSFCGQGMWNNALRFLTDVSSFLSPHWKLIDSPCYYHVRTSFTQCSPTTPMDAIRTCFNNAILFRIFNSCSQSQSFPSVRSWSTQREARRVLNLIALIVFWDLNCILHAQMYCGLDRMWVSVSTFTSRNIWEMPTHLIVSYTGMTFAWSKGRCSIIHLVSMARQFSILVRFLSCPSCDPYFPTMKHFVSVSVCRPVLPCYSSVDDTCSILIRFSMPFDFERYHVRRTGRKKEHASLSLESDFYQACLSSSSD